MGGASVKQKPFFLSPSAEPVPIALDDAQVKAVNMAYSVAKAMVTTAAGLLLAIPAMLIYFYLRGRVVKIVANVEAQASELIEALTRSQHQ